MLVDMPMVVTLNDAKIEIPKIGQANLGTVEFPIVLCGFIGQPRIKVETQQFVSAVKDAAVGGLKQLATDKAANLLKEHLGDKIPQGLIPGTGEGQNFQLPNLGGEGGLKLPKLGGEGGLKLPGEAAATTWAKPGKQPNNAGTTSPGFQLQKIEGENGIQLPGRSPSRHKPAPKAGKNRGKEAEGKEEKPSMEDEVKGLLNNFLGEGN